MHAGVAKPVKKQGFGLRRWTQDPLSKWMKRKEAKNAFHGKEFEGSNILFHKRFGNPSPCTNNLLNNIPKD